MRGEKEELEEEEKVEIQKCQGRFLRAGAFSPERTVSIRLCTVHTFYSPVPFTDASLCRTLAAVFHCIMVYKQPPPSLHRLPCFLILSHSCFSFSVVTCITLTV